MTSSELGPGVAKLIALAGTVHVGSYQRRSKSGKVVDVSSYMRSVGSMSTAQLQQAATALHGSPDPAHRNQLQRVTGELRKRGGTASGAVTGRPADVLGNNNSMDAVRRDSSHQRAKARPSNSPAARAAWNKASVARGEGTLRPDEGVPGSSPQPHLTPAQLANLRKVSRGIDKKEKTKRILGQIDAQKNNRKYVPNPEDVRQAEHRQVLQDMALNPNESFMRNVSGMTPHQLSQAASALYGSPHSTHKKQLRQVLAEQSKRRGPGTAAQRAVAAAVAKIDIARVRPGGEAKKLGQVQSLPNLHPEQKVSGVAPVRAKSAKPYGQSSSQPQTPGMSKNDASKFRLLMRKRAKGMSLTPAEMAWVATYQKATGK